MALQRERGKAMKSMKFHRSLAVLIMGLGASAATTIHRMTIPYADLRWYFGIRGLLEAVLGISIFLLAILMIASWHLSRRVLWTIFGVCAVCLGIGMLCQSRFAYIPSTAFIWAMSACVTAAMRRGALALITVLWIAAGIAKFSAILR